MVGRRAVLADSHLTEGLALQEPAAFANRDAVGRAAVRCVLVPAVAAGAINAEFEHIAGRHVGRDLRFADEAHAALLDRARADVNVRLSAVVKPHDGLADPARHRQADLAIAFARRRGLKLSHPLFEIGAAIAAEIRCSCRHRPCAGQERRRPEPPTAARSPYEFHNISDPRLF